LITGVVTALAESKAAVLLILLVSEFVFTIKSNRYKI
jgi:hypothetical protein